MCQIWCGSYGLAVASPILLHQRTKVAPNVQSLTIAEKKWCITETCPLVIKVCLKSL